MCYSMGCGFAGSSVNNDSEVPHITAPYHIILKALTTFINESLRFIFNPVFLTCSPSAWPFLFKNPYYYPIELVFHRSHMM